MDDQDRRQIRLSDRILSALELAIDQEDVAIAEALTKAMELSVTRKAGGGEFVERRDYPPEIESALKRLDALRERS